MKKFLNKIRNNNKGFTLVELIIVIAIIAVLSAAIAPQYIKWVENSKESADEANLGNVLSAVQVEAAETTPAAGTIKIPKTGVIDYGATGLGGAADYMGGKFTLESKKYAGGAEIVVTLTGTDYKFDPSWD